jgi:hypothetical protein
MFTSHGYEKESEDSDTNQMKENISSISESQEHTKQLDCMSLCKICRVLTQITEYWVAQVHDKFNRY